MRMAQDRNFVVIAIISAFVAAAVWWGPAGWVSHAALPRFKNESAKTSEPLMFLPPAAADEPKPAGQLTSLSRGGGHKLSSTLAGTVQFSAANYSVGEGDQRVTLSVTRSGDTSGPATVALATSDLAGAQNCNAITGIASSRCDYETSIGTVKFAAGETSKSVSVAIIDDAYLEGPETFTVSLTNPSGATLGSPANATVTIADNDVANGVSPSSWPASLCRYIIWIFSTANLTRAASPSGSIRLLRAAPIRSARKLSASTSQRRSISQSSFSRRLFGGTSLRPLMGMPRASTYPGHINFRCPSFGSTNFCRTRRRSVGV